jgi:rare lipoprotein A (peptidoglycan hydrolase)
MRFGTTVQFCANGRCVVARCTDRGPYVAGRSFDLSRPTFAAIELPGRGWTVVTWTIL